ERARGLLMALPDVTMVYTTIGAGVQTGNIRADLAAAEVRKAQLTAVLRPTGERGRSIEQIRIAMREALAPLPGARVTIGRGTPGEQMTLMLSGSDPESLLRVARDVAAE